MGNMPKIQNINSSSNGISSHSSVTVTLNLKRNETHKIWMPKIGTFDAAGFWKNAFDELDKICSSKRKIIEKS